MKQIYTKLFITCFSMFCFCLNIDAQTFDVSDMTLKANYPLSSNGTESTGNYGNMSLSNPTFLDGAIYSPGCYVNDVGSGDSCLIETPQIDALNDLVYAIQVDFKATNFGKTIIMAGNSYRFLGIETNSNNKLVLRLDGNYTINDVTLQPNQWYNIALKHNTIDSMTHVFLDNQLIFSQKKFLFHPQNDTKISNTDFGLGKAFEGYLKNLKVYSTNTITSINSIENVISNVYPNPAIETIQLQTNNNFDAKMYLIFSADGKLVQHDNYSTSTIALKNLTAGVYSIQIVDKNHQLIGTSQFIIQ